MSTVTTGDATQITPLTKTVSGATNASPIVITTSTSHLLESNDWVSITGVGGNTNANGVWKITKLSATTFSLSGSTGNAAYTSGGSVESLTLAPQYTRPDDGDAVNGASLSPSIIGLSDRAQYLALRSAPLPDLTALASIKAPADGTTRYVVGQGPYTFRTSATTGLSPFRVAAADATAGGWVAGAAHEVTLKRYVSCGRCVSVGSTAGAIAGLGTSVDQQEIPCTATHVLRTYDSLFPVAVYGGAGGGNRYRYFLSIDEYMVDGATLSSAVLNFTTLPGLHAGVPTELPQFCIYRRVNVSVAGAGACASSVLKSGGGGYVTLATPANVAAYEVENTITIACDQNNVIDRTTYRYFAVIGDEARTNAVNNSNIYHSIELNFSAIPDARRA